MKKLRLTTIFCLTLCAVFLGTILAPINSSALSGSEFNPGYIIDDSVFFNGSAMTTEQIQQFLNAKVPICDTNHAASGSNTPPFTCLKDYRQDVPSRTAESGLCNGISAGNKSAAQIIQEVGFSCNVSQKALIVLLQKEQSLITDTWPWAIQYRSATGYGCPDTAPCDAEYYGFFNQVYSAARQFKKYVRDSSLFNFRAGTTRSIQFNPNAACGGSSVYIQNPATAALYNYTPYQPNQAALNNLYGTGDGCSAYGNRNFWRMFTDWFGTTKPAGKWLRQSTANGQVWLVTEGIMPDGSYARKKFKINSWEIFQAYFLQYEPVVPVSEEYLSQYDDDGNLGTLAIGKSYPHIQFVDNGYRYYIDDSQQCTDWDIGCFDTAQVKTIPGNEFLERLTGNGKIRSLVSNNNVVYKMQNGKKNPVIDGQSFYELGYSWSQVVAMQDINMVKQLGPPQVSHQIAIQFNPTSPVMLYSPVTYQFYRVPNYEVFSAWNMQSHAFLSPPNSAYTSTPPSTSSPDLSIWAWDGGSNKYIIDQGRKIDVSSVTDLPVGTVWQNIATEKLSTLPMALFGQYAHDISTGAVYLLEDGQKRLVPSWEAFVGLHLNIGQLLPLSHYTLEQFPDGQLKLNDSATFTYQSEDWLVNGSSKLKIPNNNYFMYYGLNAADKISNQPSIGTAYTGTTDLSVLAKDTSGNLFVLQNGTKLNISPTTASLWGLNPSSFVTLTNDNLTRLPTVSSLSRFVYGDGYGLYYADGSTRRHIQSYSTYQALGGSPSNTFTVADDFFNASPTGTPLP